MKIIDFDRKGNLVRFFLGEKTPDWGWTNEHYTDASGRRPEWLKPCDTYYGDDWDDTPYECNAGEVYEEFVKGHKDVAFGFDDMVLEPADVYRSSSGVCKDDMKRRQVPCLIVVPKNTLRGKGYYYSEQFEDWVGCDGVQKFYFGDDMDPDPDNGENA